jgi:hypothetical protein
MEHLVLLAVIQEGLVEAAVRHQERHLLVLAV